MCRNILTFDEANSLSPSYALSLSLPLPADEGMGLRGREERGSERKGRGRDNRW